jgi:hypothetical protein
VLVAIALGLPAVGLLWRRSAGYEPGHGSEPALRSDGVAGADPTALQPRPPAPRDRRTSPTRADADLQSPADRDALRAWLCSPGTSEADVRRVVERAIQSGRGEAIEQIGEDLSCRDEGGRLLVESANTETSDAVLVSIVDALTRWSNANPSTHDGARGSDFFVAAGRPDRPLDGLLATLVARAGDRWESLRSPDAMGALAFVCGARLPRNSALVDRLIRSGLSQAGRGSLLSGLALRDHGDGYVPFVRSEWEMADVLRADVRSAAGAGRALLEWGEIGVPDLLSIAGSSGESPARRVAALGVLLDTNLLDPRVPVSSADQFDGLRRFREAMHVASGEANAVAEGWSIRVHAFAPMVLDRLPPLYLSAGPGERQLIAAFVWESVVAGVGPPSSGGEVYLRQFQVPDGAWFPELLADAYLDVAAPETLVVLAKVANGRNEDAAKRDDARRRLLEAARRRSLDENTCRAIQAAFADE